MSTKTDRLYLLEGRKGFFCSLEVGHTDNDRYADFGSLQCH